MSEKITLESIEEAVGKLLCEETYIPEEYWEEIEGKIMAILKAYNPTEEQN